MNKLSIVPNELVKDPDTQLRQVNMALSDLQSWSLNQGSNVLFQFKDVPGTDDSTTSTKFGDLAGFSSNVSINNTTIVLNFTLSLRGTGQIGIIMNGQQMDVVYFSSTGFQPLSWHKYYQLKKGSTNIKLQWLASTGTVVKANSQINLGNNSMQIVSHS